MRILTGAVFHGSLSAERDHYKQQTDQRVRI
jgi:hypothetical protein